jgi:hypothetical protein
MRQSTAHRSTRPSWHWQSMQTSGKALGNGVDGGKDPLTGWSTVWSAVYLGRTRSDQVKSSDSRGLQGGEIFGSALQGGTSSNDIWESGICRMQIKILQLRPVSTTACRKKQIRIEENPKAAIDSRCYEIIYIKKPPALMTFPPNVCCAVLCCEPCPPIMTY